MRMPESIEKFMFAPCGINCMVCYVHLKKKQSCSGCLSSDINKPEHCKSCAIRSCAKAKGITYCFDCTDFPCKRIKNLEKSYQKRYQVSLLSNSKHVKDEGFDSFFKKELSRWTCIECKGVISLHDKECSECGIKV